MAEFDRGREATIQGYEVRVSEYDCLSCLSFLQRTTTISTVVVDLALKISLNLSIGVNKTEICADDS
jgi:hypothetical protein